MKIVEEDCLLCPDTDYDGACLRPEGQRNQDDSSLAAKIRRFAPTVLTANTVASFAK